MYAAELIKKVKEDNVKYLSLQFTDIAGSVKSVDIPVQRLPAVLEDGIWFDGSSVEGFARIQESDMRLVINPNTYAVLPWTPAELRRGRVFCDIYQPDGQPFPGDPRGVLKRMLAKVAERGWTFNVGPEPEFFLFKRNKGCGCGCSGSGDGDNGNRSHNTAQKNGIHPVPHDVGGYFDFSANDEAVSVRTELMEALYGMGLEIEMGHHEEAIGQHEIDFRYADALTTADNVLTLKYTVKAIAAKHGLIASFMPKPIFGINGSGMHCHQSLFDKQGNNLFFDAHDKSHLSKLAYGFIAGQLHHARALSAILAPTINSYKRLVPGYEAPVYIGWAEVNRSALIRIPRYMPGRDKSVRAELRCPDPTANPYLAFAAMLAAALDGVDAGSGGRIICPVPLNNVNIYELSASEREAMGIASLPLSLAEALQELSKDDVLRDALGEVVFSIFHRAKLAEVEAARIEVTDWEIERYLEAA